MRLTHLHIKKFKRFVLSGINEIIIDFQKNEQIIIGVNGYGKSSLLGEMSMLPAIRSLYYTGGYKEVRAEKDGKAYTCISDFTTGQKHYFHIDGGPNLNESNLITVQKELVERYFGLTQELFNVILGLEEFTGMSPSRRKDVLTKLSDTDYTFVTKLFAKCAKDHRDLVSHNTLTKKTIAEESSKLVNTEEADHIKKEYNELSDDLGHLLILRNQVTTSSEEITQEINKSLIEVKGLGHKTESVKVKGETLLEKYQTAHQLLISDRVLKEESILNASSLFRADVHKLDFSISEIEQRLSGDYNALYKLKEDYEEAKGRQGLDLDELIKIKDGYENSIQALTEGLKIPDIVTYSDGAFDIVQSVMIDLEGSLSALDVDLSYGYTKSRHNEAIELEKKLLAQMVKGDNRLTELKTLKDHYDQHQNDEEIHCPQCDHGWLLDYDKNKHEALKINIDKGESFLIGAKAKLEKVQSEILLSTTHFGHLNYVLTTLKKTSVCQAFLEYILEEDLLTTNPKRIIILLRQYANDMGAQREIKGISKNLELVNKDIQIAKAATENRVVALRKEIDQLEKVLSVGEKMISERKEVRAQYKEVLDVLSELNGCVKKAHACITQVNHLNKERVRVVRDEIINRAIVDIQNILLLKKNALDKINQTKEKVEYLQSTLDKNAARESALKLTASTLSPTEGLIAKGLVGFINLLIGEINGVLASVWGYELEVLPCDIEETDSGELNYKFPIKTQSGELVSDVSEGSSGIRDVINLAFQMVVSKALKLDDFPLYLDEPGARFDPRHRHNLIAYIQRIIEEGKHGQLFMISHYEEGYMAFPNAGFIVLGEGNQIAPAGYNENVILN